MSLVIDDFIEIYPQQDNPYFNSYIAKKKEFNELVPSLTEGAKKGDVFVHQEFAKRFITDFNRLFIFHQAGTGKTLLIIHSREYFKRSLLGKGDVSEGKLRHTIKKAYILTSGKLLQETFYNEIIKHAGEAYMTDEIRSNPVEKSRLKALKKRIRQFYTLQSYSDFAKNVKGMTDAALDVFMTDVIIYVDEVQGTSTLNTRKGKNSGVKVENNKEKKNIYSSLHRAFHRGNRNKIVLLTATPMINEIQDYSSVINLILPLDRQMGPDFDWEDLNFEDVEPYTRGRVSYIRRQQTGAIPVFKGENIVTKEKDKIKIWKCRMSKLQSDVYKQAPGKNFEVQRLQISNFVFPDLDNSGKGTLTPGIYKKFISKDEIQTINTNPDRVQRTSVIEREKTGLPKVRKEYEVLFQKILREDLHLYSEKFSQILKIVSQKYYSGKEDIVPDAKGTCFIYSEYVEIGADIISLMFQYNGYEPYLERSRDVYEKGEALFPKRKRFALITGFTPEAISTSAFATANDSRNKFGEYLQVIIGSAVTGKGITINNAAAVIFVTPQWNRTKEEQARDRIFRSLSSVDRIEYKKQHNLEPVMDIEIYRMASIPQKEDEENLGVDVHLYSISQDKSKDIAQMIRFNKINAVDATMNLERNIQPLDVDFSEICNYQKCEYSPYLPNIDEIETDYAGKLRYYMTDEVKKVSKILGEIFLERSQINLQELLTFPRFRDMDIKYVLSALEFITNTKSNQIFYDRFGVRIYIREKDDIFFIEKDPYNLVPSVDDSVYYSMLMKKNNNYLQDYISPEEVDDINLAVSYITTLEFKDEDLDEIQDTISESLEDIDIKVRILLFEKYFEEIISGSQDLIAHAFYNIYRPFIYTFTEPVKEINKSILAIKKTGRGRKTGFGKGSKEKVSNTNLFVVYVPDFLDEIRDSEKIYIHNMIPIDTNKHKMPSYTDAKGHLRVFKPKEGKWRDTNSIENEIYKKKISNYRKNIFSKMNESREDLGFYGVKLPGSKKLSIKHFKGRKWSSGKMCDSFLKPEVLRFINILKRDFPEDFEAIPNSFPSTTNVKTLCIILEEMLSVRDLVFKGVAPQDICIEEMTTQNVDIRQLTKQQPNINDEVISPTQIVELDIDDDGESLWF